MALRIIALVLISINHTAMSGTDCCTGIYAPVTTGCANSTGDGLKCIYHLKAGQECIVSDDWTTQVECDSCCEEDLDGLAGETESSLAWILSLVLSIFFCTCCAGLLIRYERRRRREDTVLLTHVQRITSPLAEAQVTSTINEQAVVVDDQSPKADCTDDDIPVAQLANLAHGVPIPSTRSAGTETVGQSPLELGNSISNSSLLNSAHTV